MPLRARWSLVFAVLLMFVSACDSGGPGPTPVSVVISAGDNQSATVGSVLSNLQIEVRDAEGVAIGGLTFGVAVQSGGGTYTGTVTKTIKGAPTPLGTWTLGTTSGVQALRVTAGSLVATISATALAGAPAVAEVGGAPGAPTSTSGGVGAVASIQPSVRLRDSFGNAVVGRSVSVAITGGGTVSNPNPVTDATGLASVGVWTLGTLSGTQRVTLSGTGLTPAVFTAQVAPGAPARITVFNTPAPSLPVAAMISNLEFAVEDQFGNGIPQTAVTFSVISGGGQVTTSSVTTNAQGRAAPGTWTLGPLVGVNALRMTAGALQQTVSVTSVPGAVTTIAVIAGAGQSANVSTALAVAPVFVLTDAFGNAISGQIMTFTVLSGGGTLAAPSGITAVTTGHASPGTWTLGNAVGSQAIQASVGPLSTVLSATATSSGGAGAGVYNLEIRYIGTPPSAPIQAAFTAATARIGQMISGDVPSVAVSNFNYATECDVVGAPVVNETIDDMVIFVTVGPIDGVGGTLGRAGPCYVRLPSYHPYLGDMELDVADLNSLLAAGALTDVILHEMLHVVGIGTIWGNGALAKVNGQGGDNPFFVGSAARAAYLAAGGTAGLPGVPVENTGGPGTRDGHWRESVFGRELMTGFYNSGGANPLSAITIAALGDLGYTVSVSAADAYTVSASLRAALQRGAPVLLHTEPRGIRGGVSSRGVRTLLNARRD
jgi:hypothetical protein